ncbi:MAG TPA: CHAT domain-containing protein, partial [Stellaceae bacterium]
AFEDPANKENSKFVDGFRLGALLKASGVPVLVLNACQSAFAEAPAAPDQAKPEAARAEIEAYGSLAQAVVEAGAAGVVAMRYSVYVVTAAQFVAELYGALARGRGLGEAVTWARKNLHDQPERRIAYAARPLQDWSVPVVWERAPLQLWPQKSDALSLKFTLDDGAGATPGGLDQALPARPVSASSAATRRSMRSTAPSTPIGSCCCTPLRAAARPRPRRSSRAGMR